MLTPDPWSNKEKIYAGVYLKNHPEDGQKYPDLGVAARADFTVVAAIARAGLHAHFQVRL